MSAVTAVPIRPIAKGSVLKLWLALVLLVAAAAALAWWDSGAAGGDSGLGRPLPRHRRRARARQ